MTLLADRRKLLVVVFTAALFAMAARPLSDPDLWWHLRTGELIFQRHAAIHADPFSFTRLGQPWINHEWLSDVLMYAVYRFTGWSGLLVAFAGMTTVAYLMILVRCSPPVYVAVVLICWGAVASVPNWGVRPQIFSLLMASIFLYLMERSDQHPQAVLGTIPLMLLWLNLHAGFALGIILLLLFALGSCLDVVLGVATWETARVRLKYLLAAAMVCGVIVPLNPNGIRLYSYPLETLRSQAMQMYISEWFSPNLHQLRFLPFTLLLLSILALLPLSPNRLRPRELLLLMVTAFGAMISIRHIPIFVLIAVPALSRLVQSVLQSSRLAPMFERKHIEVTLRRTIMHAVLVVAVATFAAVRVAVVAAHEDRTEAQSFPSRAVNFLLTSNLPGPILNHYNWGGYLIWKAYPRYPVFIDGRADLYGDEFLTQFAVAYHLTDDWQSVLRRWQIRAVILPPDAPLVENLSASSCWRKVYADSQAVILTRNPR